MATLAAVVLIPVGIAGTSYLLSEEPKEPSVPAEVELEQPPPDGAGPSAAPPSSTPEASQSPTEPDSESGAGSGAGIPGDPGGGGGGREPTEEVVPGPPATEGPIDDDWDGYFGGDDEGDGEGDGGDDDGGLGDDG